MMEQNAAIMAIPVVLVNDSNATNKAAASQCLAPGLFMLMSAREIYNKHMKGNSLHRPWEKMIVPGSKANSRGMTQLSSWFRVLIKSQAPMATKPDNRKPMDICEASSGAAESTPNRPSMTGYKGGKWLMLRINCSNSSVCTRHGE